MKIRRRILLLLLLNVGHIFLFFHDAVDCMPSSTIQRRQQTLPLPPFSAATGHDHLAIVPVAAHPHIHHRQSPFLPNPLFSGPLTLAAFLFALPMIPSLVMAPLALAGLPSAMTALTSMMSAVTHGKPLNSYIQPLIDPLANTLTTLSAVSGNASTNILLNQPIRRQLKLIKTFAQTFRTAINKRYSVTQSQNNPNLIQQDIPVDQKPLNDMMMMPENELEELTGAASTATAAMAAVANAAAAAVATNSSEPSATSSLSSLSSTLLDQESPAKQQTGGDINVAQMEKTIKGMDILYSSIRDIYSVIRNGLRRYEITDTECQSRIVCEIHKKIISRNKLLKTFSLNALDVLNLERHIDSWNSLNQKSKETIKFYINAAKVGFADKDCMKEFRNCPTLQRRRSLRNIILSQSLPHF